MSLPLLAVGSLPTSLNTQAGLYSHQCLSCSLMLSKYSTDNETQGSKDSKNIIPYNVLCINSFSWANPTSLSGHHNRANAMKRILTDSRNGKVERRKGDQRELKYSSKNTDSSFWPFFFSSSHLCLSTFCSTNLLCEFSAIIPHSLLCKPSFASTLLSVILFCCLSSSSIQGQS